MSNENERTHKVGPHTLKVATPKLTTAGLPPTYPLCTPDRWGMRYSDTDPQRRGQLMYPVAKDFGCGMKSMMLNDIQWGDYYLGVAGSTPKLKLTWPISSDQFSDFVGLFSPIMTAALTSHACGFGIPGAAMPNVVSYNPGDGGEQGAFTANLWELRLNPGALADPFKKIYEAYEKEGVIGNFVNTIYHEARHCQQWFWIYALVLQHPGNFEEIPNIFKWPFENVRSFDNVQDKGQTIVSLAAQTPIPGDTAALISLKRMAVGQYLYTLNWWRKARACPAYLGDWTAFDEEYQRVRTAAIDLLQHTGIGGTPIDVDAMVAEPRPCSSAYSGRPWENDAFACGNTAEAYWKEALGLLLYTPQADECSKDYASAYDRDRGVPLQRAFGGTSGAQ